MTKMNKKREYTHEDIEAQGRETEVPRQRARQVDQAIRIGAISHELWVSAAYELMERKKEILPRMMGGDDVYRSMIPCYYGGLQSTMNSRKKSGIVVCNSIDETLQHI